MVFFYFYFFFLIMFQGMPIHNNAKKGVIVQQYSLALRKVDRSQAGNYMCVASNVEGDGYSDTVELKIMCKSVNLRVMSIFMTVRSISCLLAI